MNQDRPTLLDLHAFVREAQEVASVWRPESWAAEEFTDGQQYTQESYDEMKNAGIDPLTINRIFPTVNLLQGLQIVNKFTTQVKGRTQKDTETGQLMTEGVQFVNDQYGTEFLVSRAYRDQLVPGIGWLMVGHNPDPREEKIRVVYRDWKEMWWDPYAEPWLDPTKCRYVFQQPYMDVEELAAQFPDKGPELRDHAAQMAGDRRNSDINIWYDEAQQVEDLKETFGGRNRVRRRVRPVEMWYPVYKTSLWAKFEDGTAKEIPDTMPAMEVYAMVQSATQVIRASVKRMWTTTFLDNIILYDGATPFNHDLFPFVPFIGYLDRYGFPFGVPHHLKGQQVEVNKRRSMALALLQKRRVIAEAGVVGKDKGASERLQKLYEEANKLDGFMVVEDGKKNAFEVVEGVDHNQLKAQVEMLRESERELQEISGANAEQAGYKGQALSGIAIEKRQVQSSTILAPLTENLRRSMHRLGTLQVAEIQGQWTGKKVLRITDRMTGAEKFVALNERVWNENTRTYDVRNNVTQGKFDLVITDAPPSDTVREQNMNLLIEWAKKSPPEIIPYIMHMAMELSNLPNKELLLSKLKPLVGIEPGEEDMTADERKAAVTRALEQHKQQAQEEAEFNKVLRDKAVEKAGLQNDLLRAQIDSVKNGNPVDIMKVKVAQDKVNVEGFKVGAEIGDRRIQREREQQERYQQVLNGNERREATA